MAAGKHVACPHVLLNSKAQKIWKVCWSCGKLKEKCSELRETRFLSEQLHKTMLFMFLCQLSFNIPVTLEITSGSQMIKVIFIDNFHPQKSVSSSCNTGNGNIRNIKIPPILSTPRQKLGEFPPYILRGFSEALRDIKWCASVTISWLQRWCSWLNEQL